jgi:hypothetical protein
MLRILEISGSNKNPEAGMLAEVFYGFPQSVQTSMAVVPQTEPQQLTSTSFLIQYSLIVVPFNAI